MSCSFPEILNRESGIIQGDEKKAPMIETGASFFIEALWPSLQK
jgi:hypothetical protein